MGSSHEDDASSLRRKRLLPSSGLFVFRPLVVCVAEGKRTVGYCAAVARKWTKRSSDGQPRERLQPSRFSRRTNALFRLGPKTRLSLQRDLLDAVTVVLQARAHSVL